MKRHSIHITLFTLLLLVVSCQALTRQQQQRHLTEPLFLMRGGVTIAHYAAGGNTGSAAPRVLEEQAAPATGAGPSAASTRVDTGRVYAIPEVTVTSRARFAPLRNGKVDVDFVLHIPKAFLSDDYHIRLTPQLLLEDSVVKLDEVVLRGKNFIARQEEDYDRYNAYIASIIDPAGYDTAFINRTAVEQELQRRRKHELGHYYARWNRYQEYLKWHAAEQEKYDRYNIRQAQQCARRVAQLDNAYRDRLSRLLFARKDTAAFSRAYRLKRRKLIAQADRQKQITISTVPAHLREFYRKDGRPEDIEPLLPREEDSLRIASTHVMREHIALNELKDSRREEAFKRMVPVPYQPEAHYNGTIVTGHNFNYRYTRPYPVGPDLKKFKLTLRGVITATDRSKYNIRRADTLIYLINRNQL